MPVSFKKQLRTRARAWFFGTLRKAFETDDGRNIAIGALNGLVAGRPRLPAIPFEAPYADLPGSRTEAADYSGTVFITARFRTGSTLLWNIFRHCGGCRSYYEPLNERRWFDAGARGDRIDPTHRGVDDYWREYEGLTELGAWHRVDWTVRGLYMDESAWDADLQQYFDRLILRAGPDRAVLQCNRIDFRLPWLRRQFPGAAFVHLYRHPRDQWCSALMQPRAVPRDVTLGQFEPYDHFYLERWGVDLRRHFPFLPVSSDTPPYLLFYFIWKLSYLFGVAYADVSLAFEDLVAAPERQIRRLMQTIGVDADAAKLARLVSAAPTGQWRSFADDGWFRPHEEAAERVLAEFFRNEDGGPPVRPVSPATSRARTLAPAP
jgi:hypothetical protein